MRISLFADKTVSLDLKQISRSISLKAPTFKCKVGMQNFSVPTDPIVFPDTYSHLPQQFYNANSKLDLVICFTAIQYDNNYFYQYTGNTVIVSFSSWMKLTSLPMNNGALYFILMLLSRRLKLGPSHKSITGCINDFNGDKRGINLGMRSAYLCPDCTKRFLNRTSSPKEKGMYKGLKVLLNELSLASRDNVDIVKYWHQLNNKPTFDVFLCHNSVEKSEVRKVSNLLKKIDIKTWLDVEQLRPGFPWQDELEKVISRIGAAAVFVGKSGIGPWQDNEIRAFLVEFVRRKCAVIPVLLPGAKSTPKLPIFLNQMTWVDLRKKRKSALEKLAWGITGRKPER